MGGASGSGAGGLTGRAAGAGKRILVVDDDELTRFYLEGLLADLGYDVDCARSGEEALAALARFEAGQGQGYGVILLDRVMTGMSGMEVLARLAFLPGARHVPVIMVTGSNAPEEVREAIEAGVFYYLPKPVEAGLLASVVGAALRQAGQRARLTAGTEDDTGFRLATAAKFAYSSLAEAEKLAGFCANFFPDPERSIGGIAALMVNAVEHGICGIGFALKGELIRNGTLAEEIERRCAARAGGRPVEVTVVRRAADVALSVTDPGPGFDWREFMEFERVKPMMTHGRGIIEAKISGFDKLVFNEAGNQAIASVTTRSSIEW
ncbi:response regulator [Oceanicella sp. SM1341]|uniref:response regulator n=1 Tax=Oceanicella sp. SM1341 TaxID=1548889 RepID=UPI0013001AE7|nr:response regulator [Oceanicella sp. SM1341]